MSGAYSAQPSLVCPCEIVAVAAKSVNEFAGLVVKLSNNRLRLWDAAGEANS